MGTIKCIMIAHKNKPFFTWPKIKCAQNECATYGMYEVNEKLYNKMEICNNKCKAFNGMQRIAFLHTNISSHQFTTTHAI